MILIYTASPILILIVWLLAFYSDRSDGKKKDNPEVCIKLRNMQDEGSENKVVSAWMEYDNREYCAELWLSSIGKTTTLRAKSKKELEKKVQQTYEELRNLG